jgi:hypothetical protein
MLAEAYGSVEFETGAKTSEANQLIMFADNDKEVYDFALRNRGDVDAIYSFCKDKFERMHGALRGNNGDEETIMYDFFANYGPPDLDGHDEGLDTVG